MDPRLVDHIERVRAACEDHLSVAARVERIHASACELVSAPIDLAPPCREVPSEGYGRHLLFRCRERGFSVLALIWPEGAVTPAHDHGGWGVVAVSEGRIEVTDFLRVDDGTREGHAQLRERRRTMFEPGQAAISYPPHDDVHRIANAAPGTTITIHTYAVDIKSCRIFDVDEDRSEIKHLRYDTEFASA